MKTAGYSERVTHGRVNSRLLQRVVSASAAAGVLRDVLLCGGQTFCLQCEDTLVDLGVPSQRVHVL